MERVKTLILHAETMNNKMMKKTIPLLILSLLAVCSCQQQPLDFLRSMGVGVDSLMMDTIPQPYHMSGYMLTPEQYDQLFGEKLPYCTDQKNSRITAIRHVKENYLISIATYSYFEFLGLFSATGKLLDGVYCGIWDGEPSTGEKQVYEVAPLGKTKSYCEFTSDTTFSIHSSLNMAICYRYQIKDNRIFFKETVLERIPAHDKYEEYSCCGPFSEAEEAIFDDLLRHPISDDTVLTEWNRMLSNHHEGWREINIVSHKTIIFYRQNPQRMLRWIDQHRNDSIEYISWSLMANCSRDKYLKEHLKQQLEQYPNPELKVYLDNLLVKQQHAEQTRIVTMENTEAENDNNERHALTDAPFPIPEYPGGDSAMKAFIKDNIQYPIVYEKTAKGSSVIVSFTVEKDGRLTNIKVVRGLDPFLDKEAIRIVRRMPRWIPARREDGKPIKVDFTISIRFRLN